MLNLALDTATPWGRFALADGERLLAYRPLNIQGSYADALLPVITDMLDEAGFPLADLAGIGVTRGPGSFTGVRIGVATVKALAYALSCELVAVTTLEAMAAALLREHPRANVAVPVLDARRGEIFAGIYERRGGWIGTLVEGAAGKPDQWWERVVAAVEDPEEPVYGGEGTPLLLGQGRTLRPQLRAVGQPRLRAWTSAHPRTAEAMVLAMGQGDEVLPRIHPFSLTPRYLRVSDAEIKRKIDLTPLAPRDGIPEHDGDRAPE